MFGGSITNNGLNNIGFLWDKSLSIPTLFSQTGLTSSTSFDSPNSGLTTSSYFNDITAVPVLSTFLNLTLVAFAQKTSLLSFQRYWDANSLGG